MGKNKRSANRTGAPGSPSPSPAGAPAPVPAARKVVFVLGPPRSGTSAISHVIERLGVSFGDPARFVDPALHPHNPVFFELRSVNELNERICRRMGAGYAEFALLPVEDSYSEAMHGEFRDEIAALVHEEFGAAAAIGLKDPRFVITLPFWRRVLAAEGYEAVAVVTERDTDAARKSNREVNRSFSDAHNQRIVELSKLLAAWQSRRLPSLLVDFDRALADPAETATRLSRFLGIADADLAQAAAVLDPRHRHHPGAWPVADASAPDGGVDLLAVRAGRYEALLSELREVGALDLLSVLLRDRDQALSGVEHAELARHAAEQQFQSARGLAVDYAAGYANLQALHPLSPVLRTPLSMLYVPDENGALSELRSLQAEIRSRQGLHVAVFRLPASDLARILRFDPDVVPGVYRMDAILIDERPQPDLDAMIVQGSGAEPGHVSRFAVSESDDPWWRLDLADRLPDGAALDSVVELQIEFRRMNAATLAGDAAAARVKAGLVPVFTEGFAALDRRLLAEAGALAAQAEKIAARADSLSLGLEAASAQADGLMLSLDAISAQTGALAAKSDAIAARTDALASQCEGIAGQGLALTGQVETLATQTETLSAKALAMEGTLARVQAEASTRHDQVLQGVEAARLASTQAFAEAGDRFAALEQGVAGLGVGLVGATAQLSGLEQGVAGVGAGLAESHAQLVELQGRLDALAAAQQRQLALAERRTLAYWWNRWFGAKAAKPESGA